LANWIISAPLIKHHVINVCDVDNVFSNDLRARLQTENLQVACKWKRLSHFWL